MLIWTDGSAKENDSGASTAGAGIFYGNGNDRNRSVPVRGASEGERRGALAELCLELGPQSCGGVVRGNFNYLM